jgi:hypothetical protein
MNAKPPTMHAYQTKPNQTKPNQTKQNKEKTPNANVFFLFLFQCFRERLSHAHEYVSPERQRNAARMMLGIVNANFGSTLQKGNLAETFKCNAGEVGCRGKEEGFVM